MLGAQGLRSRVPGFRGSGSRSFKRLGALWFSLGVVSWGVRGREKLKSIFGEIRIEGLGWLCRGNVPERSSPRAQCGILVMMVSVPLSCSLNS